MSTVLTSADFESDLAIAYQQNLARDPTDNELDLEETSIMSGFASNISITWDNVSTLIDRAYNVFITSVNPISVAQAKSSTNPAGNLPYITPDRQKLNLEASRQLLQNKNIGALLSTIQLAEGGGDYVLYGNKIAKSIITFPSERLPAGDFQIEYATYQRLSNELGLSDFSHDTQQLMGARLIIDRGVADLITSGNLRQAISFLSHEWAALPMGPGPDDHSFYKNGRHSAHPESYQPNPMNYNSIIDHYKSFGGFLSQ